MYARALNITTVLVFCGTVTRTGGKLSHVSASLDIDSVTEASRIPHPCSWTAPNGDVYDFSLLEKSTDFSINGTTPNAGEKVFFYNFCRGVQSRDGKDTGEVLHSMFSF